MSDAAARVGAAAVSCPEDQVRPARRDAAVRAGVAAMARARPDPEAGVSDAVRAGLVAMARADRVIGREDPIRRPA